MAASVDDVRNLVGNMRAVHAFLLGVLDDPRVTSARFARVESAAMTIGDEAQRLEIILTEMTHAG